MNTQKVLIGLGIAVVLVLGVVFPRSHPVAQQVVQQFGGFSGNQPTEPIYLQGGFASKVGTFLSTTSIVCMAQNPSAATSTFRARWTTTLSTTTTTVLVIATSTNAGRFATTSGTVLSVTLAANAQGLGSYIGANNQNAVGPGEWVQVGYGAGTTLPTVAQQQSGLCGFDFYIMK